MPFRLATALATVMRLMTIVIRKMLNNTCLAYLDNMIIFGLPFNKHLNGLYFKIKRLKIKYFKLKP